MKYLIANWKMKLSADEEIKLAEIMSKIEIDANKVTVSLNPSHLSLAAVVQIAKETKLSVGAQDCFWEDSGAYTGEISPRYLKSIGCKNVIIGHSERRGYLGESDNIVNKKVQRVIDNMMTPVLCVGESREDRENGNKDHIVRRQVELALQDVNIVAEQKLLVAYEPIWAIGTGNAATSNDIVHMHQVIYQTLIDILPHETVKNNTFVLYGGSVDSDNIERCLELEVVDGVLVGGASLKVDEFSKMIKIANNLN